MAIQLTVTSADNQDLQANLLELIAVLNKRVADGSIDVDDIAMLSKDIMDGNFNKIVYSIDVGKHMTNTGSKL